MSRMQSQALVIALMMTVGGVSIPAWGAESGKWRGRAVLVLTSEKNVEVNDKADHSLWLGVFDGVVFTEVGGDFLANARYQVADFADEGGDMGQGGGYKTFTMPDDSKIFARYELKEHVDKIYKGEWKFLNGTGRYQGITGNGTYEVHVVADGVLWDLLEGEYKLP
jgi:hypothetical protein